MFNRILDRLLGEKCDACKSRSCRNLDCLKPRCSYCRAYAIVTFKEGFWRGTSWCQFCLEH